MGQDTMTVSDILCHRGRPEMHVIREIIILTCYLKFVVSISVGGLKISISPYFMLLPPPFFYFLRYWTLFAPILLPPAIIMISISGINLPTLMCMLFWLLDFYVGLSQI